MGVEAGGGVSEGLCGGAQDEAWFGARIREATNPRDSACIMDHLAKYRETIVADVQRSFSRGRVGHDAFEGQIRMTIEVAFSTGNELLKIETRGAAHPRHQPLLNQPRGLEFGQKWPEDDMGEFVPIGFAIARGADENQLVGNLGPAPDRVGAKRKELKTSGA